MTRSRPLSAVAFAAALLALGSARAEGPEARPNPHGAPDQCATCHLPGPDAATTGPARSSAVCSDCHPGEDHHPVDNVPVDVRPAAGWPLEDGKLSCITCHVEPAHEGLADLPPPWYRGGPYAEARLFCDQCHTRADVARSDPHHPASPYAADDPTCGACHLGIPERGAAPEASRLRLGPEAACSTCHPHPPHWGMTAHVGQTLPVEIRDILPPEMPLLGGSVVACWTCHDVHAGHGHGDVRKSRVATGIHDRALADEWAGAPPEVIFPGANPEHPPMLALPLEGSALCAACHGEGP